MKAQKVHTHDGRSLLAKREVTGPRRCGKSCYSAKKQAKQRAVELSKRLGEPIEAYKCFKCHAFHVGHPPGWREANGREPSVVSRQDVA